MPEREGASPVPQGMPVTLACSHANGQLPEAWNRSGADVLDQRQESVSLPQVIVPAAFAKMLAFEGVARLFLSPPGKGVDPLLLTT